MPPEESSVPCCPQLRPGLDRMSLSRPPPPLEELAAIDRPIARCRVRRRGHVTDGCVSWRRPKPIQHVPRPASRYEHERLSRQATVFPRLGIVQPCKHDQQHWRMVEDVELGIVQHVTRPRGQFQRLRLRDRVLLRGARRRSTTCRNSILLPCIPGGAARLNRRAKP